MAQHRDRTGRGVDQPGEHFQRRRLARAVGPQEADDFARRHVEAHAVDGGDLAARAAHQAAHRGEHPCLALVDDVDLAQVANVDRRRAGAGIRGTGGARSWCNDGDAHGCGTAGNKTITDHATPPACTEANVKPAASFTLHFALCTRSHPAFTLAYRGWKGYVLMQTRRRLLE